MPCPYSLSFSSVANILFTLICMYVWEKPQRMSNNNDNMWPDNKKTILALTNLQILSLSKTKKRKKELLIASHPSTLFFLLSPHLPLPLRFNRLILKELKSSLGSTFHALHLQFAIWFQIIYSLWRHKHTHTNTDTHGHSAQMEIDKHVLP